MRVVLDINVFVSALISPTSPPGQVVAAAFRRRFALVVCPQLIDEMEDVLGRSSLRRYFTSEEAEVFLIAIEGVADEVEDPRDVPAINRDPDDDYLVALAVAAADVLVTGDADLLDHADPPVQIRSPRSFMDELGSA